MKGKVIVKIVALIYMFGVSAFAVTSSEWNALVALYNATDGNNWKDNSNWLQGDPCTNNWYGVTCDTKETTITRITLNYNDLTGTIPNAIGDLQSLNYLNLGTNHLSGSLPSTLTNLQSSLTQLILSDNHLSGQIDVIFTLSNLTFLDLHENDLTGRISNIGKLPKIHYLNLGSNQLNGTIPSNISLLVNMSWLELYGNDFTGTIPNSLTSLNTNLTHLNLAYNRLNGEIPSEIQNMNLDFLYLVHNCNLYSNDQSLISYINNHFTSKYSDIVNTNECPTSQSSVNMAPIISYLLSGPSTLPPKPSEPTNVQAAPIDRQDGKIRVTWMDTSNNESSFVIYRSTTADSDTKSQIGSVGANTTSFTDSDLDACQTYYYWVGAKNTGGMSVSSDMDSARPAPYAPKGLYARNPIIKTIDLHWNASSCATKYHIYQLADEGWGSPYQKLSETGDITTPDAQVLSAATGIYIFYRVAAENSDGIESSLSCYPARDAAQTGANSVSDSCHAAVGWARSDKPQHQWGSYNNYTNLFYIGWDSVVLGRDANDDPSLYARYYNIQYLYNGVWTAIQDYDNGNNNSTPIKMVNNSASPDTTYRFRIRTHYTYAGQDTHSDWVYVNAKTAPSSGGTTNVPAKTWITTSKHYPNFVMLGWGTVDKATYYQVSRRGGTGTTTVYNGSNSRYNDTGCTPYTDYWYKVRSCNSSGCSAWSDEEFGDCTNMNWSY